MSSSNVNFENWGYSQSVRLVCIDNFLLDEMNSHEYLQNIGTISVVQFC